MPAASIGGQETQLFVTRGNWLTKRLRFKHFRVEILPVTMPFPAKIVYRVLAPLDVAARFGEDPDVDEVDACVRSFLQAALDALGREPRLPILG